ncbi:ABC transporter ATP-binding protein [Methylobacterium oryzihabitans]|uniref:ATP-binding cassette domain-containing protein n=1 Tax=Methylobacterium oryzihabitans TaxID=2499852 RepID=A0A3S2YP48_9HYPH|nr:ATP-binding cassette domain-containing protein [Methylobacterium oryzihabitans]RVU15668.1 ATP-binding cassette domain-containing protein [Methylobacterium oryzihabitans]
MIEVQDLVRRYGDTAVVDGVSLRLPERAFVSVIGANGAGKSSLLSMVARLLPASAGRALVAGLDVAATPGDVLARRLGILRQDNGVAARVTIRDLVAFGRYPHSRGRLGPADHAAIADALRFLDLEPLADRFLDEVSGGQRQRAFIAMVLAQDTDCILLDEPLNNLDMRHAAAMMALLRRAVDERGRTIVAVLHDVNFASCYSDLIVAMRDGKVVAVGPPDEIVTPAVLREVYGIDVEVVTVRGYRTVFFYR